MKKESNLTKKTKVPYLFTDFKRFFRNVGIKYYVMGSAYSIATKKHPKFPTLLISFLPDSRIRFAPIPLNGWSREFTAYSAAEAISKMEKIKIAFNPIAA